MRKIHIGSMASVVDDNNVLWMSNVFFNGLFRMDLDSQELCCVGAFEGADLSAEELHKGAHISGKEIIFTPFYDQAVRIYHTDSDTYQTIAIPGEHKPPFSESVRVEQNIFFLSGDGYIWNYDIEKHSLTIDELSADYKKFLNLAKGIVLDPVYLDGFLLVEYGGDRLCRIDLVKRQTEIITIDGDTTNFESVFYEQGLYWFTLKSSQDLVLWNGKNSEFTLYKCGKERWGKSGFKTAPYSKILYAGNTIWMSNYTAMSPVRIDKNKRSIEPIVEDLEGFQVIDPFIWGPIYPRLHVVGQDICFVPCHANLMLRYNYETGEFRTIETTIPQEKISYFDEIVNDKMKNKVMREREEIYTLKEFIKSIKNERCNNLSAVGNANKNMGRTIWENFVKI